MELTPAELKRLRTLATWHRHPPTIKSRLPKVLMFSAISSVIVLAFAVLSLGNHSPLLYYCLGVISYYPLLATTLAVQGVKSWKLSVQILDWQRIDDLLKQYAVNDGQSSSHRAPD